MKNFYIVIIILLLIGAGIYFWKKGTSDTYSQNENNQEATVCTMDAKVCPDGSYVGRVAPSCDFAPCPQSTSTPSGASASSSTNIDTNVNIQSMNDSKSQSASSFLQYNY